MMGILQTVRQKPETIAVWRTTPENGPTNPFGEALAPTGTLGLASSHGAMSLNHSVGVAGSVAGNSRTRVPPKSADDGCGGGVLQEDGG